MAAASTTVTAPGTISPKVFWPLVVAVVLTFLSTFLAAVTPQMLSGLGELAFPMGLALGAVSQVITAYMKSDELRDLGVRSTAAVLPVYTDQVVPPAPVRPAEDQEADREAAAHSDGRALYRLSEELRQAHQR